MWDVGLAKMFKERDKSNNIGACVGKIVAVSPLRVSILNGQAILQGDQLYITGSLLNKEYAIDISGGSVLGNVAPSGNLITFNMEDGNATLKFGLKQGDEVLLIPAENEQVFFIVDIVKKVGG